MIFDCSFSTSVASALMSFAFNYFNRVCDQKGEEVNSLIKIGTDVRARALGFSGVNFCPGIRFWEVNFARALGFCNFSQKCVIFDKVKKVIQLLKNSNFGTPRFMKTFPVIRVLGTFLLGH